MKTLIALLASTSIASAGNLVYEAPAEPLVVIENDKPMGSMGAWLIPFLALGVIAIAVSSSQDDDPATCTQDCEPPPPECITKSCVLTDIYGNDDWKNYYQLDRRDVREYWELTGEHAGIGDWSGYQSWLEAQ